MWEWTIDQRETADPNTREVYEKDLPNGLRAPKSMVFAGLILEGGIIGYDSMLL